jgi:hypothetical protein
MDWIQISSWAQTLTIIGVIIAAVAWIHSDIRAMENRLDAANMRIDQLYTAFYDLLKDHKEKK